MLLLSCRFPAQERVGGASKIPTIIYYDREGKVRAVGAEATSEAVELTAEEEGWTKAEW
jgi:nitrate reductase cytochrome c-type subunit